MGNVLTGSVNISRYFNVQTAHNQVLFMGASEIIHARLKTVLSAEQIALFVFSASKAWLLLMGNVFLNARQPTLRTLGNSASSVTHPVESAQSHLKSARHAN